MEKAPDNQPKKEGADMSRRGFLEKFGSTILAGGLAATAGTLGVAGIKKEVSRVLEENERTHVETVVVLSKDTREEEREVSDSVNVSGALAGGLTMGTAGAAMGSQIGKGSSIQKYNQPYITIQFASGKTTELPVSLEMQNSVNKDDKPHVEYVTKPNTDEIERIKNLKKIA